MGRGSGQRCAQAMAELAELRRALDERLLHMLGALETLQDKREEFNRRVEQGWFSLSKARFAMGCKSVSALQYGAHMEPQVRVCTSQGQSGPVTFQVIPGDLAPAAKTAEESPAGEGTRTQDPVMRRRKGPGAAEDPGPLSGAAPKHPAAQHGASPQDPLTWFGILVPQSLRQAQNSFKEGILLAGEIASLQSEIEVLRVQYRVLLERKHQLLAAEG